MHRAFEPTLVTRLLAGVEAHGTAAGELFLVLYAIRGLAALASFAAHTLTTTGGQSRWTAA
jgi:hypothetical protein